MNLGRAFAEGLLLGTAANLIADGMSDHFKEKGWKSQHIIGLALLLVGAFVWIYSLREE